MNSKTPRLTWVKLQSTFQEGGDTNSFFGARISNGWLVWNHHSHAHTMTFVPDPPGTPASDEEPEVP